MVCTHLRELYDLCQRNHLRFGGSDLIRIVCKQCDQVETCPSVLTDEYDSAYRKHKSNASQQSPIGTERPT